MAEDTTGWSEKGKGAGSGKRPAKGDAAASGESTTPSRPSKRDASSTSSKGESSVVRTPSGDAGARKVAKAAATAGQRDVSFASRLGFPVLIAAICLVGIFVVAYARTTREALAQPVQNLDHWHSVYGVYNCNLPGEGEAKYLPPFQSTDDENGIHSHGDGVLHIHPFFEASSGNNAVMQLWMNEMKVDITPEIISINNVFDPSVQLVAGEECADGSGKAEIKLLHWQFDFEATGAGDFDARTDPTIITEDFGSVPFRNDREVFIFAYVGEDFDLSTIPNPPQVRFDTLNNVSAALEYQPTQLIPQDTGVEVDAEVDAGADDSDG